MPEAEATHPTPLPKPRRLVTPERETLLRRFRESESQSMIWLGLELAIIVGGILWWQSQQNSAGDTRLLGWQSILIFTAGCLGLFDFVIWVWLSNRKRLEDIRPDAKFGVHTRDSLLAATRRVQERLGLTGRQVSVYLAKEKDINAFALRQEFLPGWHLFNHVQLNRSIVHLLDEKELESVIGHELGHVFPYSPIASRCLLVHALLAGVLSLLLAHLARDYDAFVAAPLFGIFAAHSLAFSTWTTQIRLVEFLCDDFGAKAAGLVPAMTSELKLAAEQEARSTLLLRVMEAKKKHSHIPIEDLMQSYEDALPFGGVEEAHTRKQMEENIKRRLAQDDSKSLKGLYQHMTKSGDTDDDALDEIIREMRALRQVAKLPLALAEMLRQQTRPSARDLEMLVALIEGQPDHILVHVKEELDDRGSTHPNYSRRLLYLWRNQDQYDLVS